MKAAIQTVGVLLVLLTVALVVTLISGVPLAAVLRRAFPEWNVTLEALLVAMIGVHQLAGPICFNWVLRRAGEVTHSSGIGEANAQDGATVASGGSVVADGGSRV